MSMRDHVLWREIIDIITRILLMRIVHRILRATLATRQLDVINIGDLQCLTLEFPNHVFINWCLNKLVHKNEVNSVLLRPLRMPNNCRTLYVLECVQLKELLNRIDPR